MDKKGRLLEEVRKEYRALWIKETDRLKELHQKELLAIITQFERLVISAPEKNWKVGLITKAAKLREKYERPR